MKRKLLLATAIAGLLGSFQVSANPVIDLFSTDQGPVEDYATAGGGGVDDGSGTNNTVTTLGMDILGGVRDVYVRTLKSTSATRGTTVDVSGGIFSFSSDATTDGYAAILWDGDSSNTFDLDSSISFGDRNATDAIGSAINSTGLGGMNFWAEGTTLVLDVLDADLGFKFAATIVTDDDEWTRIELGSSGAGTFGLPFAAFENPAVDPICTAVPGACTTGTGGAADLTNVGAVFFEINTSSPGQARLDMTIDQVTIPEPGPIALLSLGLLGLGGFARKKARKS